MSAVLKTEGAFENKISYANRPFKNVTPTKNSKKVDEWKFVSIQIKEDPSKSKTRKADMKINSQRSDNQQPEKGPKMKSNSSMNKYLDKTPRLKELGKLTKGYF